ncbi:MAG: crossover junction endodeoxyribonuclease RuvC [Chitinophagales bacterium]|jgi:crossover junction endodeoxyribonuclease RuvC
MIEQDKPVRILGIDPGTNVLGFAILEVKQRQLSVVEIGVLTFTHIDEEHVDKLKYIFEQVQDLVHQYRPSQMAIEAPFFGKNVQAMLKLGRAQGVAMAAGMVNGLSITEYLPKKIKKAVTGNGNASKEQVAGMLENILKRKFQEKYLDATDALAAAVCHHFQSSNPLKATKTYSGWAAFVKDNPTKTK